MTINIKKMYPSLFNSSGTESLAYLDKAISKLSVIDFSATGVSEVIRQRDAMLLIKSSYIASKQHHAMASAIVNARDVTADLADDISYDTTETEAWRACFEVVNDVLFGHDAILTLGDDQMSILGFDPNGRALGVRVTRTSIDPVVDRMQIGYLDTVGEESVIQKVSEVALNYEAESGVVVIDRTGVAEEDVQTFFDTLLEIATEEAANNEFMYKVAIASANGGLTTSDIADMASLYGRTDVTDAILDLTRGMGTVSFSAALLIITQIMSNSIGDATQISGSGFVPYDTPTFCHNVFSLVGSLIIDMLPNLISLAFSFISPMAYVVAQAFFGIKDMFNTYVAEIESKIVRESTTPVFNFPLTSPIGLSSSQFERFSPTVQAMVAERNYAVIPITSPDDRPTIVSGYLVVFKVSDNSSDPYTYRCQALLSVAPLASADHVDGYSHSQSSSIDLASSTFSVDDAMVALRTRVSANTTEYLTYSDTQLINAAGNGLQTLFTHLSSFWLNGTDLVGDACNRASLVYEATGTNPTIFLTALQNDSTPFGRLVQAFFSNVNGTSLIASSVGLGTDNFGDNTLLREAYTTFSVLANAQRPIGYTWNDVYDWLTAISSSGIFHSYLLSCVWYLSRYSETTSATTVFDPVINPDILEPSVCLPSTDSTSFRLAAASLSLLTIGITAGTMAGKMALKRSAVAKLGTRSAAFEAAQKKYAASPTAANRKALYKANSKLNRAWKLAKFSGLSTYNGFSTGAAIVSTSESPVLGQITSIVGSMAAEDSATNYPNIVAAIEEMIKGNH